jgi:Ca-activated chloride channel family protein
MSLKKTKSERRLKMNIRDLLYTEFRTQILPLIIGGLLFILLIINGSANAAGLLKSVGGNDSGVSIRSHRVDVVINNGFARTEVDQVFSNDRDYDMEAVYTFPLPIQASLSELSLWINGAEVVGEVVEKERARKIYEDQKALGNDTALAEKDDYKTFDISVGRVPAGQETRVRLVYYQPVDIDLNVGRYQYPLAEGNVDDERIQFWSVDDNVSGAFSFKLKLKSAFPISEVRLPGLQNEAVIQQVSEIDSESSDGDVYEITLDRAEGADLSNDIIFYYRLDDSVPARLEVIPFRQGPDEDGTFMVVVTPAADLKLITEGTDWNFILDISGSMNGHKIATLTDGVSRVLGKMSANDRFGIITFNNSAYDFTPGYVNATAANVQEWIGRVTAIQSGGGTNLYAGLKRAYNRLDDDRTTSFILVTDGVANVGETRQKAFLKLLENYDIRLFTFVIGNSANQPLLERLAEDSGGFAMNISNADDITGRILQAKAKVLHENLHDVELKFSGERVTDLTPLNTGNLYMGQQLLMFGRYAGSGDLKITLNGKISGQDHSWQTQAHLPEIDRDNPELERLWALSVIEDIMEEIREDGEKEGLRKEIVALGTEYSLVTDYTSMVVLSEEEMENEGIQRRNADRVQRERSAQTQRQSAPVKNYRVDNSSGNGGMFNGRSAPGIGSGPVGPLFVAVAYWIRRRKMRKQ